MEICVDILNTTKDDLDQEASLFDAVSPGNEIFGRKNKLVSMGLKKEDDVVIVHPLDLWKDSVILSRDLHQLGESKKIFDSFDAFGLQVPLALEILLCFQDQIVYHSDRWFHRRIWELDHPEIVVSGKILNFTCDQYPRSLRHDLSFLNLQHFYTVRFLFVSHMCILGDILHCCCIISFFFLPGDGCSA